MKFKFKLKSLNKIQKTDLSITIVLLIGIIIVVNFFSYKIFYRFDLTQGKIYSISTASKKTVGNLEDIVNIKAYFSNNLPSEYMAVRQDVADILNEYQNYSNGKIKVEFIDPGSSNDMKMELYQKGIPQITFQTTSQDQAQMINGYMGIAISYGDKIEVVPMVKENTSDLEYQITTAIKKATAKEVPTIGYVTSNKTADPNSESKTVYAALQELYKVEQVQLDKKEISSEIKILIIFGPKDVFTDDQLKTINTFLAKGGSLYVLMDGAIVNQNLAAQPNGTNLDKLLAKYGVIFNKDLIADERNAIAPFSQNGMVFFVNYPYWLKITNDGFDKNNSTVASLENVIMPWASSLTVDESKISRESITALAFTTNKAWEVKDNFNLNPSTVSPGSSVNSYNVAMTINGVINNAYPETGGEKQFNSRITVVGDSDFATDNFINGNADNGKMFLNLVDGLSLDQDLINIRSKNISSRPIKELSEGTRNTIRYLNIFGITIIVIVFGLARYYLRRKSKFIDEI